MKSTTKLMAQEHVAYVLELADAWYAEDRDWRMTWQIQRLKRMQRVLQYRCQGLSWAAIGRKLNVSHSRGKVIYREGFDAVRHILRSIDVDLEHGTDPFRLYPFLERYERLHLHGPHRHER